MEQGGGGAGEPGGVAGDEGQPADFRRYGQRTVDRRDGVGEAAVRVIPVVGGPVGGGGAVALGCSTEIGPRAAVAFWRLVQSVARATVQGTLGDRG